MFDLRSFLYRYRLLNNPQIIFVVGYGQENEDGIKLVEKE